MDNQVEVTDESRVWAVVKDVDLFMTGDEDLPGFPVKLVMYLSVLADNLIRIFTST